MRETGAAIVEARQKSSGAPFGHKSGFFWQTLQSFIAMHKITQAWAATENRALHGMFFSFK